MTSASMGLPINSNHNYEDGHFLLSRDTDGSRSVDSLLGVLEKLLGEKDDSRRLSADHLDAILHLRSAVSSRSLPSDPGRSRQTLRRKPTLMLKMEGFIRESVREAKEERQGSYYCHKVLETYGAEVTIFDDDSVQFNTHVQEEKVVPTREPRNSGKRIGLLLKNHRVEPSLFLAPEHRDSDVSTESNKGSYSKNYCPPEWMALTPEAKIKLVDMLSWEKLSSWKFNVVEVAELTRDATKEQFCPLLIVGWALLCEPYSQEAMKDSLLDINGINDDFKAGATISTGDDKAHHYHFDDRFKVDHQTVCNFLREVESRYHHDNPYHNNIHAADVTQSTHCLLQMMDRQYLKRIDPIEIFSLLLAAGFHDVGHPGTTNLFQQNALTPLAIRYNDVSILENMHSAVGHSMLMGEEKRDEWDVFKWWDKEDKLVARHVMTTSILGTDMSNHFVHLTKIDSLVDEVRLLAKEIKGENYDEPILSIITQTLDSHVEDGEDKDTPQAKLVEKCRTLDGIILRALLHAADLSNPVKTVDLAEYWAHRVLNEFFQQGDMEKKMDLPISPLCDRDDVNIYDSQIGFLSFISKPTFQLLGEIIPKAKDEIVPNVGHSIEFWKKQKAESMTGCDGLEGIAEDGEE